MKEIIRLVKFYYRDLNGRSGEAGFTTVYDDVSELLTYEVALNGAMTDMPKEAGNALFKKLRGLYPNGKVLVIVDKSKDFVKYRRAYDHYEIVKGGRVVCTCDNMDEVREEIDKIEKNGCGSAV